MSDLEQLQKNLTYKIKAQDIGFNSWQGSHGKPQKMFIPTKDYLLNSASKQQDEIKKRNEMMEDYLDEQRAPVVFQDEEGNIRKYKYHSAPLPTLEAFVSVTGQLTTPEGVIEVTIAPDEQQKFLNEAPAQSQKIQKDYDVKLKELEDNLLDKRFELADFKIEQPKIIKRLKDAYESDLDRLNNQINDPLRDPTKPPTYDIMDLERDRANLKKRFNQAMMEQKQYYKNTISELEAEIRDYKNDIDAQYKNRLETDKEINELLAKVRNEQKKNEKKVKDYAQELNNLNRGELDTVKQFNETDEEYFERLKQMADIPFADRRSEEKALIREKDKLRDNLKLIIRDNSKIGQVINSIFSTAPLLMHEANKFFPGFKDFFIKKYGENNEKIKYQEIINELNFYIKRSTDPRVLSGNVPTTIKDVIPFQQPAVKTDEGYLPEGGFAKDLESILQEAEALTQGQKPIKKVPSVGQLTGEEESGLSEEEGETSEGEQALPIINYELTDNDTLIKFTHGDRVIFVRYVDNFAMKPKIKTRTGEEKKTPNYDSPNFFYSLTGKKGSFELSKGIGLFDKIAKILDIPSDLLLIKFGVNRRVKISKKDILDVLTKYGLKNSEIQPFFYDGEPDAAGRIHEKKYDNHGIPLIGLGIKQSQDLPDKVPFGSNILFLKKLFLKNILSIQNKHNTKINGFNNVHVSDNFVKIIMNLLKGLNFTNSELQNLSNGERILLDNLLMLSELNKKFVTGSSTASLNQLKKDYEILIGEIEAGNNNEILKKKLYNLLMRMVHFGALSQIQALKHYKEILKSHF